MKSERLVPFLLAAGLLLAALACGPLPTLVVTATPTPQVACAPLLCPEGQMPFCPGECPGGCGLICVTPTPGPMEGTPSAPGEVTPAEPTTAAGCTLGARWVADVTVPDNTEFAPGTPFVKTWRVRNSGTCAWEPGTRLVFISGTPMGGPAVDVPALAPGAQTDVSVSLTAPATPGTYRANYQFQAPDGTRFGAVIWVQIVVPAPATQTPVPPTEAPTSVPTVVPTPFGGGMGKIAYVSLRDGNAEIYVMGENDAAPIRLTNNSEIDDWPDWSPDGTRIAFERWVGSKPDIYVMNADGSLQTNITNDPAYDTRPSWSPDGTRIAFSSDRVGGKLQIWVMKADGTGLVQLANTPELNMAPDWSPDGNRITFESTRDGQREIYVMNSDGTGQTRLTFSGNNYGPKWSPDGSRIVFSSSNGIWSIKPDGTLLTQLTTVFDLHPSWSPDGTQIVFDSQRSGNQDLYTMNTDGTGIRQLTANPAMDANAAWR